jgi:hypothetical protein
MNQRIKQDSKEHPSEETVRLILGGDVVLGRLVKQAISVKKWEQRWNKKRRGSGFQWINTDKRPLFKRYGKS